MAVHLHTQSSEDAQMISTFTNKQIYKFSNLQIFYKYIYKYSFHWS